MYISCPRKWETTRLILSVGNDDKRSAEIVGAPSAPSRPLRVSGPFIEDINHFDHDAGLEVIEIEGRGDVIKGAQLDGLVSQFFIDEARDHDDGGAGIDLPDLFEGVDAASSLMVELSYAT